MSYSQSIKTGGGTYIGENAIAGGDIVMGDKNIHIGPTYRINHRNDDVAKFYNSYTQNFIERETVWQQIVAFTQQRTPGYLLIEALPGYGKTALLTHLLYRHENNLWEQPPTLLYFFIRQERQRNTATYFLQAVNSQLLNFLQEYGGVPSDVEKLRVQFSDLWSKAIKTATAECPLLLMVDGLDESARGEITIATELPTTFSDYVHVIITFRPNAEQLKLINADDCIRNATRSALDKFGEAEAEALLRKFGVEVSQAAIWTPRILSITAGHPLFVRFICQEVAESKQGENALKRLEDNPPAGVHEYFEQQFARLNKAAEGELAWEILGLLTVTLSAISPDEIKQILNVKIWQVRRAIEPIQRFLLGSERFELMHQELRKKLLSDFDDEDRAGYRDKLLIWCKFHYENNKKEIPAYILDHYAQHLVDAGQKEKLYNLINKRWMDLKFAHSGSLQSFSKDVDLAIQALCTKTDRDNLIKAIQLRYLYVKLDAVVTNMPLPMLQMLVRVQDFRLAQEYATLIQEPEHRCFAYFQIAVELIQQEKLAQAAEIIPLFKGMIKIAKLAPQTIYDLCSVADGIAKVGNKKLALQLANHALETLQTANFDQRNSLCGKVAPTLIRLGDIRSALAAAYQASGWLDILENLVLEFINAGHLARLDIFRHEVLNFLSKNKPIADIAEAFQRIAIVLLNSGYKQEASKTAIQAYQMIQENKIAEESILETSEDINPVSPDEIATFAHNREQQKRYREATRVFVLKELAATFAALGEKELVQQCLHQVIDARRTQSDNRETLQFLLAVAEAAMKSGAQGVVSATATYIKELITGHVEWFPEPETLGKLAVVLFQSSEYESALLLARQALHEIERKDEEQYSSIGILLSVDYLNHSRYLASLAAILARTQNFTWIIEAAQVLSARRKSEFLRDVAITLIDAGEIEQVWQARNSIVSPQDVTSLPEKPASDKFLLDIANTNWWSKKDIIERIAHSLAKDEKIETALIYAEELRVERKNSNRQSQNALYVPTDADFLQVIIKVLIEHGKRDQAFSLFDKIESKWVRALVLQSFVTSWAQDEAWERALEIAGSIEVEGRKARSLLDVAALLVQHDNHNRANMAIKQAITS